MSIFSNFLKLFKYEPTIDAQNTFNIQTALNDNWDKVDDFAKGVSQQMEDKADKESPQFTGTPTINGNEIATVNDIPSGLSLGETSSTAYRGDRGKIAYEHSQSSHAPSNAQKNSDITKAEIESKLIGEVSTHSHASDSTKAPNNHASTATTYGLGTIANYGHVKIINDLNKSNYVDGEALSANQGHVLNNKINTDIGNVFQRGDIRRSTRDLSSLGYIPCDGRELPVASNTVINDLLKYNYGAKISNMTWRNNPITQTDSYGIYNNYIFFENGIIFLVLATSAYYTRKAWYSTDSGVSFTEVTMPSGVHPENFNIKYVNGVYALRYNNMLYTTTNFFTWTLVYTIPNTNARITSIDYFSDKYVISVSAINPGSGFYYSTDLTNWTLALDTSADWVRDNTNYHHPVIVAGNSTAITFWNMNTSLPTNFYYTTTNGIIWTKRTPTNFEIASSSSGGNANSVIWCSGMNIFVSTFKFITDSSYVTWSNNGIDWYDCSVLSTSIYGQLRVPFRGEYPFALYYDSYSNTITGSWWGSSGIYNNNAYISKDGKKFSIIDVPRTLNNNNIYRQFILPTNGKSFMYFMYYYNTDRVTCAFGTANIPTADYFKLPVDPYYDSWLKL